MNLPFSRVDATVLGGGHTIVEWRLNPLFRFGTLPLSFYIDTAKTAGEWERLNPDVPTTACWFVDEHPRRCSLQSDTYYRVVATDGTTDYISQPADTMGVWNPHDYLICRDILRKESLRLRKLAGTAGTLLKRREYGAKCPTCQDIDVGGPVNSSCAVCFGTGIQGGYYAGLPYAVDLTGPSSAADVQIPFGTQDNAVRTGRGIAYPQVHTYDLWVGAQTNQRYVIREIQNAAEVKGKPLVYLFKMSLLPGSAPEQAVPLEIPASTALPDSEASLGWRPGLTRQEY